jgi:hypothetical protein
LIAFKTPRLAYEWHLIHPILRLMEDWILDKRVWPGNTMTITSVHRGPEEQGAVNPAMAGRSAHGVIPVRANDVRIMGLDDGLVLEAVAKINKAWSYDFNRPHLLCALLEHNHVHLQVHANTTFEGGTS